MSEQAKQSSVVEWFAVTIDCSEPEELANFYAAALGGRITRRTPDSAIVKADGQVLVFRQAADYQATTWPLQGVPLRSHFELIVSDLDAAMEATLQLGAKIAEDQDPEDPDITVMVDPAGNPFCLIRSAVVPHD